MSWGSLTSEDVEHIRYLAGHLMTEETCPEDPHTGASVELALDGFSDLKDYWKSREDS